jgi:hypothetical protein
MKYDWQIARLEDRVKTLEELVGFLQQELESRSDLRKGFFARARTVRANLTSDPTAWQKDVQ